MTYTCQGTNMLFWQESNPPWSVLLGNSGLGSSLLGPVFWSDHEVWSAAQLWTPETLHLSDENGWYSYMYIIPPKNVLLQFQRRDGVCRQWVGTKDFDWLFDVSSLYWRFTGIGKQQVGL